MSSDIQPDFWIQFLKKPDIRPAVRVCHALHYRVNGPSSKERIKSEEHLSPGLLPQSRYFQSFHLLAHVDLWALVFSSFSVWPTWQRPTLARVVLLVPSLSMRRMMQATDLVSQSPASPAYILIKANKANASAAKPKPSRVGPNTIYNFKNVLPIWATRRAARGNKGDN